MEQSERIDERPKQIVIDAKPVYETPRQREVRTVSENARAIAIERLKNATTLPDYIRWHQAAAFYLTPKNIDWIWEFGGTTVGELIAEQESEDITENSARRAGEIESLEQPVNALNPKENMIRVGLKRVQEEGTGIFGYRVFASFPIGASVDDPIDEMIEKDNLRTTGDTVFFKPESPCMIHACDDLYEAHGDSAFYMPERSLVEAIRVLQSDRPGAVEYLIEDREEDLMKQDPENYLLVGLLGGYSNEQHRVRISDFRNKGQIRQSPTIDMQISNEQTNTSA